MTTTTNPAAIADTLRTVRDVLETLDTLTNGDMIPGPCPAAAALMATFTEAATATRDHNTATNEPHPTQPAPFPVVEITGRAGSGGLAYRISTAYSRAQITTGPTVVNLCTYVDVYRAATRYTSSVMIPLAPNYDGAPARPYWDRQPVRIHGDGPATLPPGAAAAVRDHVAHLADVAAVFTPARIEAATVNALHREAAAELVHGLGQARRTLANAIQDAATYAQRITR